MHSIRLLSRLGTRDVSPRVPSRTSPARWSVVLLATLVAGCFSEPNQSGVAPGAGVSQSGNRPPVIQQVVVLPAPLTLSGPLGVQIEAADPDRNPLTYGYQWFINGHRVEGETQSTLSPTFLKRGDRVEVEIVASDSYTSGKPNKSEPVTVGNTLPEVVGVAIEPTRSDRSEVRAIVEGVDADRDAISYVYRWRRNATLVVEGEHTTLDTSAFHRGDSITVEVIPRDAGGVGTAKLSAPVALENNAPKITSYPPSQFEKGLFVYGVQAIDDDKDSLKYVLDTAPSGMTIDSNTGMISWQVAPDTKGIHRVRIVVQDGYGGSASQDFDLSPDSSSSVKS
ncbi:MAG: putative Ig domain-containing protein [Nitrospirota bacterium]